MRPKSSCASAWNNSSWSAETRWSPWGDCNLSCGGAFGSALRVKDAASLEVIPQFTGCAILLDAYVPGQLGGTGARFNWDLAIRAKEHHRPILLAGGLTPENIRDAVAKVRPYGVDVSSGVESAPGQKNPAKIEAFITAARSA